MTIHVHGTPPPIRLDSNQHDYHVGRPEIENVPHPGNTFEAVIGGIGGAQNDGVGVAFSGSTSLENRYIVDGIDITGLTYGNVRHARDQRVHQGDRDHHRRLQRRVRPRHRRHRQRRHAQRQRRASGLDLRHVDAGVLDRGRKDHAGQRVVDRRHRQPRVHRERRVRARRTDRQEEGVVLPRRVAAARRDRLHAHDQARDRLPQAPAERPASRPARPTTPMARPISIRRPASILPTSSTRTSAARARSRCRWSRRST